MKKLFVDESNKIISKFEVTTCILNIGAGKILPIDIKRFTYPFLINLDNNYITGRKIKDLEALHDCFRSPLNKPIKAPYTNFNRCKYDVYKFLETYYNKFDLVTVYRFLEHVEFTKVPYFIYLLSQIVRKEGLIDIIVPDYKILAKMLLDEDPYSISPGFEADNILLTTELLNEPEDPHASIWTKERILYFFRDLEKRFVIERLIKNFEFEGRDIYIRVILRKT